MTMNRLEIITSQGSHFVLYFDTKTERSLFVREYGPQWEAYRMESSDSWISRHVRT
jgi:hypothetical protein